MKRIFAIFLSFAMLFCFASCGKESEIYSENIYNNRVSTLSNADKISDLLTALEFYNNTAYATFQISGDDTVIFEIKESLPKAFGIEEKMRKYSSLLISMVRDLNEVKWSYLEAGQTVNGSIDRKGADELLGSDTKELYSDYDSLLATLVRLDITNKKGVKKAVDNKVSLTVSSGSESKK